MMGPLPPSRPRSASPPLFMEPPPQLMMGPPHMYQMGPPLSPMPPHGIPPEHFYGTFPRFRSMEEPLYFPGPPAPHMMGPPFASYNPERIDPGFYDTYMRNSREMKKKSKKAPSVGGRPRSRQEFATDYDAGIYRKPHLNEKAFSSTLQREMRSNGHGPTNGHSADLDANLHDLSIGDSETTHSYRGRELNAARIP